MIGDVLIKEGMRMQAEILTLRARVEELERNRITDEMIDRAWDHTVPTGICAADQFFADGALAALAAIGIVACDECGGSGEKVTTGFDSRLQADTDAEYECPACNGHGWRRKS